MTILSLAAGALILMTFVSGSSEGAECEECHTGSGPSGGYVFERPEIIPAVKSVIPPNEGFPFSIILVPASGYEIVRFNVTLTLHTPSGPIVREGTGADRTASFTFPGLDSGSVPYGISVTYTVFKKHTTAGNADQATYRQTIGGTLSIMEMALKIDKGFIIMDEEGSAANVNVSASEDAYAVTIEVENKLRPYVQVGSIPEKLSAGETARFTISLLHRGGVGGNVTVGWYSNGSYFQYPIRVTLIPKEEGSAVDLYHELGKYMGIAAMVLLILGYLTGGTGPFKKIGNKLFKNAARRIRFHCAMSYELLALSLFHFGVLFYGPFSRLDQILVWQTVLGIVAMIIMFVIALNGINQNVLVKAMGFANWRRVHAWGTYVATSLVIIHALTIGSEFLPIRELLGM